MQIAEQYGLTARQTKNLQTVVDNLHSGNLLIEHNDVLERWRVDRSRELPIDLNDRWHAASASLCGRCRSERAHGRQYAQKRRHHRHVPKKLQSLDTSTVRSR